MSDEWWPIMANSVRQASNYHAQLHGEHNMKRTIHDECDPMLTNRQVRESICGLQEDPLQFQMIQVPSNPASKSEFIKKIKNIPNLLQ